MNFCVHIQSAVVTLTWFACYALGTQIVFWHSDVHFDAGVCMWARVILQLCVCVFVCVCDLLQQKWQKSTKKIRLSRLLWHCKKQTTSSHVAPFLLVVLIPHQTFLAQHRMGRSQGFEFIAAPTPGNSVWLWVPLTTTQHFSPFSTPNGSNFLTENSRFITLNRSSSWCTSLACDAPTPKRTNNHIPKMFSAVFIQLQCCFKQFCFQIMHNSTLFNFQHVFSLQSEWFPQNTVWFFTPRKAFPSINACSPQWVFSVPFLEGGGGNVTCEVQVKPWRKTSYCVNIPKTASSVFTGWAFSLFTVSRVWLFECVSLLAQIWDSFTAVENGKRRGPLPNLQVLTKLK